MPSNHFLTLAPTGRVAAIHSGPFVANEAAATPTMIPAHLLNRGDEPGLCLANFSDRMNRRDDASGIVSLECLLPNP
jgi:hypothetical protein